MSFAQAFARVIGHEGGYVHNPADPGGETNWGISKRAYPDVDINALTIDGAKAIYLEDYWMKGRMDDYHPAIAFQVFDTAVNSGIETAVRILQRALGVKDDGQVGHQTLSALQAQKPNAVLLRFAAERLEFLINLSTWPTFGRGWARRTAQNLRYGAEDL